MINYDKLRFCIVHNCKGTYFEKKINKNCSIASHKIINLQYGPKNHEKGENVRINPILFYFIYLFFFYEMRKRQKMQFFVKLVSSWNFTA